jgi:hypothetical protein
VRDGYFWWTVFVLTLLCAAINAEPKQECEIVVCKWDRRGKRECITHKGTEEDAAAIVELSDPRRDDVSYTCRDKKGKKK